VNIFNPDCVVLHGGLANAGEMLLEPLRRTALERSFESSHAGLRIVRSDLGGDAGIVGAAGCVFQRLSPGVCA
jgi:glucokinase